MRVLALGNAGHEVLVGPPVCKNAGGLFLPRFTAQISIIIILWYNLSTARRNAVKSKILSK